VTFAGIKGATGLRVAIGVPLLASSLFVAGCMSSPTYGTGKQSSTQLMEDLSGAMTLRPKKNGNIDYEPRPDLVRPTKGASTDLPQPQQKIASAGNPDWPESPEQQRARLKSEIDANRDDPNYVSPIEGARAAPGSGVQGGLNSPRALDSGKRAGDTYDSPEQRAKFNAKLAESRQGSATTRKYLSEPPLTYRQPAATAATDDVGEDELKKERRRKAEARKASGKGGSWRDIIPGL
jgi:hypothetical protein